MGEVLPPVRQRTRPGESPPLAWANGSAVFEAGTARQAGRAEDSTGFLGRVQRTTQTAGGPGAYEVWRWQSGAYQRAGLTADFLAALGMLR
jgi:hypothetical protein